MKNFYNAFKAIGASLFVLVLVTFASAQNMVIDANASGGAGISLMTDANGILYYKGTDGIHGKELWKSDGTESGTNMIIDLYPGEDGSELYEICYSGGKVFFYAKSDDTGGALWVTDGTEAGTFNPVGFVDDTPTDFLYLTDFNGTLFFRYYDNVHGVELWTSDGTSEGTAMFKDINEGGYGSGISQMVNANGRLFFKATDDVYGKELWTSDGTVDGTLMVKDICEGDDGCNLLNVFPCGSKVFFMANEQGYSVSDDLDLWVSDGTEAGTFKVKELNMTSYEVENTDFKMTDVNGTLYFKYEDDTYGQEIWKSDGTVAGTVLLKDIAPGTDNSGASFLTNLDGMLFFKATDQVHGKELWVSDGTEAGTHMVKDIFPGSDGSVLQGITAYNGRVFFYAQNSSADYYHDLWASDGTEEGTVIISEEISDYDHLEEVQMKVSGNTLFFTAYTSAYAELWKYSESGLGIDESIEKEDFAKVYGGVNRIQIDLIEHNEAAVYVYDLSGKLIRQLKTTSQSNSINQLESGIYLVRVVANQQIKSTKVLVN